MENYCLTVTYDCNWSCKYCISETHLNKKTMKEVKKDIANIPNGSYVTISGGEPGTLQINQLINIIDALQQKDCLIACNTNGLLLKKYPQLYKHFNRISYHVSENLENDFIRYSDIQDKIEYLLVVTDDNMHRLNKYLDDNKDLLFIVIGASPTSKNFFSRINGLKIWSEFKDRIHPHSRDRLILSVKDLDKDLNILW